MQGTDWQNKFDKICHLLSFLYLCTELTVSVTRLARQSFICCYILTYFSRRFSISDIIFKTFMRCSMQIIITYFIPYDILYDFFALVWQLNQYLTFQSMSDILISISKRGVVRISNQLEYTLCSDDKMSSLLNIYMTIAATYWKLFTLVALIIKAKMSSN